MKIGIVSYGLCLPTTFESAAEVASKAGISPEEVAALGIERKCMPTQEDQPVPMAVKAAAEAFKGANGPEPQEVDVVIWTGEEYKDYIAQTASIRLQEEMGCRNAWAFDLVGQGVTSIVGLRVARDLMIGDEAIKTVLLAGGTRNVDLVDYANPGTRFLLAASASGGALILKRGHKENLLLGMAFLVDSEMADEVYVPGGGTKHPFSPQNLNSSMMFYQAAHSEVVVEYFNRRWASALVEVLKEVSAGRRPDYLALRHLSPADRDHVLGELGVMSEKSASLHEWGHHGSNDVIISLDLGRKAGCIRDGSLVALASAGIGFTYGAALIRWGSA